LSIKIGALANYVATCGPGLSLTGACIKSFLK